jgi:hypothetical protein
MSKEILELEQKFGEEMGEQSNRLIVTAFIGGEHGACIQLTTDKDYFTLTENQVLELITVLLKRLNHEEGYNATD